MVSNPILAKFLSPWHHLLSTVVELSINI